MLSPPAEKIGGDRFFCPHKVLPSLEERFLPPAQAGKTIRAGKSDIRSYAPALGILPPSVVATSFFRRQIFPLAGEPFIKLSGKHDLTGKEV